MFPISCKIKIFLFHTLNLLGKDDLMIEPRKTGIFKPKREPCLQFYNEDYQNVKNFISSLE